MTCEEPELFTIICDFTTLFYMILRCKSSEWLEWPLVFHLQYGALTFVILLSLNTVSSVRTGH